MSSHQTGDSAGTGRCLCGDVCYVFTGARLRSTVYHCATCRRRTDSLFSAHLQFEPAQLAFDRNLSSYGFTPSGGRNVSTHFCGKCETTLCFEAEVTPGLTALCAGTLDNPNEWKRPGRELFCVNKPDFLELDIAEAHDTQPF